MGAGGPSGALEARALESAVPGPFVISAAKKDVQSAVSYEHITTDRQLADFCRELAAEPWIGFDTEFVSEDTFRPELCLIQVAAGQRLAVIDTMAVRDVTPFWQLLVAPGHETIVHAGREELLFCHDAVGRADRAVRFANCRRAGRLRISGRLRLADVQAARPATGEGRNPHRLAAAAALRASDRLRPGRRPIPEADARRAAQPAEHLNRLGWLDIEMAAWLGDVLATRSRERWWKVSGISGLSSRSLALVRELWRWRRRRSAAPRLSPAAHAARRPDRRVGQTAQRRSKQIRAVRGMERGDLQRLMPKLAAAIETALACRDQECPKPTVREVPPQINLLGQFISSALTSICRSAQVAPSIVGTASDVRDLVAHELATVSREMTFRSWAKVGGPKWWAG